MTPYNLAMEDMEGTDVSSDVAFRVNSPRVAGQIIDGEAIVVNLATGNYYSLTGTAAEIWAGVESQATAAQIWDALAKRHGADPADVEPATRTFLIDLIGEDLIVPASPGPGADLASRLETASSSNSAFVAPSFEKYEDMAELILLDPIHDVGDAGWPQPETGHSPG